jgi:AcrR family transcriptional regulator
VTIQVEPAARGRPRDRGVDERVLRAAVQELGAFGVDAFSMSRCARRARVSKASIYLRWANAQELISDALASVATWPSVPDLGDLRTELDVLVSSFTSADAWANLQLTMRFAGDAELHPQLFQAFQERTVLVGLRHVTDVFTRALRRGELPPGADPAVMGLAFTGALSVAQQLAQTPGHGLPSTPRQVVDTFLALQPGAGKPRAGKVTPPGGL